MFRRNGIIVHGSSYKRGNDSDTQVNVTDRILCYIKCRQMNELIVSFSLITMNNIQWHNNYAITTREFEI